MSFKCAVTGKTVFGEHCNKLVIEKRDKIYLDEEGNEIGRGFEIVKEINVSDEGMKILASKQSNINNAESSSPPVRDSLAVE